MALSLKGYSSVQELEKWIAALGVVSAPVPRDGVAKALMFFDLYMPTLPTEMALSFLRCIDLSKPVRSVKLLSGEKVIAFRSPTENPLRLFYTRSGGSVHRSGLNPAERSIRTFRVNIEAPALESFTSGAIDTWTPLADGQPTVTAHRAKTEGYMTTGGGLQLIIPNAQSVLHLDRHP